MCFECFPLLQRVQTGNSTTLRKQNKYIEMVFLKQ